MNLSPENFFSFFFCLPLRVSNVSWHKWNVFDGGTRHGLRISSSSPSVGWNGHSNGKWSPKNESYAAFDGQNATFFAVSSFGLKTQREREEGELELDFFFVQVRASRVTQTHSTAYNEMAIWLALLWTDAYNELATLWNDLVKPPREQFTRCFYRISRNHQKQQQQQQQPSRRRPRQRKWANEIHSRWNGAVVVVAAPQKHAHKKWKLQRNFSRKQNKNNKIRNNFSIFCTIQRVRLGVRNDESHTKL